MTTPPITPTDPDPAGAPPIADAPADDAIGVVPDPPAEGGGWLDGALQVTGDVAAGTAAWSIPVLGLLVGPVVLALVVLGLPGAWVMILLAIVVELIDPIWRSADDPVTFGWLFIAIATLIAAFGELLEFAAGAVGAKRAGSTRAGAVGALLGGLVGAVVGTFVPFPLVGTLLGAIVGTFAGAFAAEWRIARREARDSMRPAVGATIGRVLGTLAKVPAAAAAWAVLMGACLVRLVG